MVQGVLLDGSREAMTWRGSVQVWWELQIDVEVEGWRTAVFRHSLLELADVVTRWRLGGSRKMFAIRSTCLRHRNGMRDFTEAFMPGLLLR